jgi:ADP-dependent NAD(P)H-hydrate dehydratase / NAD(P)H-hydrate epimerase
VTDRSILTAAEMRAAEERAIAAGASVELLMERAGMAAAEAIWRFAGPMRALILCGPGNNGGDGYVVARALRERGVDVAVAALAAPATPAAKAAAQAYGGPVCTMEEAGPRPLLIDALFGTGLGRGLDEMLNRRLGGLAAGAQVRAAIDLPSGVASDDGALLSPVPDFDLTITFATLKPAHVLQPAARHMGRIAIADIGIEAASRLTLVERPRLRWPGPDDHKYTRGLVTIVAGEMPGASALAASAAARTGAGAVRLQSKEYSATVPLSVIQAPGRPLDRIADQRIGAVLAGCGLPADDFGRCLLEEVLAQDHPLVLDAGALGLLAEIERERVGQLQETAILTPHEGEFTRLFGRSEGGKVEKARRAAAEIGAVVVYKGPDTVIAAPDGRAAIHPAVSNWLATGGSGDVLAGAIAAIRASGMDAFEAACAGVWVHGRAAELAGPALIADDLIAHLPRAVAECV